MASKTERHRVLMGSMNLVGPGDKIDSGQALLLDNWRVDLSGILRTRGAAATEPGSPGPFGDAGATYHTLERTAGSRYSGVGTKLYWGPSPGYIKQIGSGYDGNPIDMAFYQGMGWAMNRGKQSRLSYQDDVHRWGVNAPATAPVANAGSAHILSLETYNGTSGLNTVHAWTNASNGTTEMANDVPKDQGFIVTTFDPTITQDPTASLSLNCATAMSLYVQTNFPNPVDTTFEGVADPGDTFYIYVYATQPQAITNMAFRFSNYSGGNETAWAEVYFKAGSALDPLLFLSQTPNSWTRLTITRSMLINSLLIGADLIQSPSTIDWTRVSALTASFVITEPCEIHLNDAIFVADTGSLTGTYQWFVSFFNNSGQDGNPSPISNELTLSGQGASLSNIPIDSDPDTTGRYIYRIGGANSVALRVGTLWDNTSSGPWLDPTSDESAQNNGIEMPIDRELPPACRGVIGPIFGKLHAFSTATHPARVFWTEAGVPWGFKGPTDPVIGNWEDVGQDDDEILQITNHKTLEIFYKQRSIWRCNGDISVAGVDPVQTNSNVGLVGMNAVCSGGAIDYFIGPEGVYTFNGDYETKISGALDPIFKGEHVKLSSGDVIPPMDRQGIVNCAIVLANDRLRVSYPEFGFSLPNVVLVCHLVSPQNLASLPSYEWAREKYNGLPSPAFSVFNYEGTGRLLCGGLTANDGARFYNLELLDYAADNGNTFHAAYQSRFEDQGLPDNQKIYSDLEIDFESAIDLTINGSAVNSALSTLSVWLIFDNLNKVFIGNISSPARTTQVLRIPPDAVRASQGALFGYRAKNVSVRIEGDIAASASIFGTYIHWYPEERIADTFDSGPTDLGAPERVKEIDYVEFYTTGAGQFITETLWSDLPGSVLNQRVQLPVTLPYGRGNFRQRLPSPIDGRNFRLALANIQTGQLMQVHQARVRGRVIGEYIDGTIGEYYESPEFSVAPGRIGELKDFLLDYDVSGPGGVLDIYSDLPGHSFGVRRSLPIPYQAGRAPYVFALESALDTASHGLPTGQLFKVRLYPPYGGILRLHGRAAFRARVIGVYFEGANGEVWETQDLDLLGGMGIFRQVEIKAETSGPMLFQMFTELPNQDSRVIASFTIDSSVTSTRQLPLYARLPGNTKGHSQRFKISGNATCRLYGVRVLGRRIEVNGTAWDWADVPMEPTPDEWATIQMPVRETPAEFTWIDLPVDEIG